MRFRGRRKTAGAFAWMFMGVAGVCILLVSLPSWVLLALVGGGLVAGAYKGYTSGY